MPDADTIKNPENPLAEPVKAPDADTFKNLDNPLTEPAEVPAARSADGAFELLGEFRQVEVVVDDDDVRERLTNVLDELG